MLYDITTIYRENEDKPPRKLTDEEKRIAADYLTENTDASTYDRLWGLVSVLTEVLNTPTTAKSPLEPSPSKVAV